MAKRKVLIFGAGIGGLTVAHELSEPARAPFFDVEVVEPTVDAAGNVLCGGKAISTMVALGQAPNGYPGEHGFRFFPTFYRHVIDSMRRIPSASGTLGRATVADHLVATKKRMLARRGAAPFVIPASPRLDDLPSIVAFLLAIVGSGTGVKVHELFFFARKLLQIATSSERRKLAEYQTLSWWDFIEADAFGQPYQHYLAEGLTRTLVAARPKEINAKTGGDVLVRILIDSGLPQYGASTDRVLDGPTTPVWIQPWEQLLRTRGVTFSVGELRALQAVGGRVTEATVRNAQGVDAPATADIFVAALPVERMATVLDQSPALLASGERLDGITGVLRHDVRSMTGVQLYLDRPLAGVDFDMGHALYVDSNWALTSICQSHFWRAPFGDPSQWGDGRVDTVWSTIVSDWQTGYPTAADPPAETCSRQQLFDRTIEQLKDGLNGDGTVRFDAATVIAQHLDDSLTPGPEAGGIARNRMPLLINKPKSWDRRPDAAPDGVDNFYLASDYVRTTTDLATMEAANEAGRRAVNGMLDRDAIAAPRCALFKMYYPDVLAGDSPTMATWLMLDDFRFDLGEPWASPFDIEESLLDFLP